ncbi:STAS domain-containing protein [Streptomyces sp. NPDC055632]
MTGSTEAGRSQHLSAAHHAVDGVHVVTPRGEIDHTTKDLLQAALLDQDDPSSEPPRVVADLEGVTFMDSSGINILISANRHLTEAHGWLRVAAAQQAAQRVLSLVGLDTIIGCHPTLEQALHH